MPPSGSSGEEASDIPVDADEYILRAVGKDNLDARKQIRWRALAPPDGQEIISVMRLRLLGPDAAKAQGLAIKGEKFRGFGRALARTYLDLAADIADSREEFHGHADLHHGFPKPPFDGSLVPGEPNEPTPEYLAAVKHYRDVANMLCYFEDAAEPNRWQGADLHAACANEGCEEACVHT